MELGFNYLCNLPTELLFHITSLLVQYTFPSGSELYPLDLIEDKVGSNRFSNAVTMRCDIDHLHFDAPSQQITSLRLFGKYCYTDAYLKIVAAHCSCVCA